MTMQTGGVEPFAARSSAQTNALLDRIRENLLPRYPGAVCSYASGSRAMGFTEVSDLDVTVIWPDFVPTNRLAAIADLVDPDRPPVCHDQPGFTQDRFWIEGDEIEVIHRRQSVVSGWWDALLNGEGWRRGTYPLPVVAVAGMRYGIPLFSEPTELVPSLQTVPAGLAESASEVIPALIESYLPHLTKSAARGDGLLFHDMIVDAVHALLVAAFVNHNQYYPFAKWLPEWVALLGLPREIAHLERQLWTTETLAARLQVFAALADVALVARPMS